MFARYLSEIKNYCIFYWTNCFSF